MVLRQNKKINRKIICGKGFCQCQNRNYVHGKGVMDIFNSIKNVATPAINFITENKDALKSGAESLGNLIKIGDSTKTIVQEILKKRKPKVVGEDSNNLLNIVDKINQFKMG